MSYISNLREREIYIYIYIMIEETYRADYTQLGQLKRILNGRFRLVYRRGLDEGRATC